MTRKQNDGAARRPTVGRSSLQEERLRIAERVVQALLEAGFSSELGDDDHPREQKRPN
jgi:hypothetical protein